MVKMMAYDSVPDTSRYNQEIESHVAKSTARKSRSSRPTDRRRDLDLGLPVCQSANRFKDKFEV